MTAPLPQWRPAAGWEGLYEVSDNGQVRSVARRVVYLQGGTERTKTVPARIKRPTPNPRTGHLYVHLYRHGKRRAVKVHHLVLDTFVGPRPEGTEGCHFNDLPHDNRLQNLRWDTHVENCADRTRNTPQVETCSRNHRFTPENTMNLKRGGRRCRTCHNETGRILKRNARAAARNAA